MTNHDQTDPEFWIDCNHIEDFERDAYHEGDAVKAALIQAVIDLKKQVEDLEDLEDVETLEDWESEHGPANQYREFFYECFEHLDDHYPSPSITSDHDKLVIFDAIMNGVLIRGEE